MSEKKKNRFEISAEVQEEFVNGIAENMLKLAEKAGKRAGLVKLLWVCHSALLLAVNIAAPIWCVCC